MFRQKPLFSRLHRSYSRMRRVCKDSWMIGLAFVAAITVGVALAGAGMPIYYQTCHNVPGGDCTDTRVDCTYKATNDICHYCTTPGPPIEYTCIYKLDDTCTRVPGKYPVDCSPSRRGVCNYLGICTGNYYSGQCILYPCNPVNPG